MVKSRCLPRAAVIPTVIAATFPVLGPSAAAQDDQETLQERVDALAERVEELEAEAEEDGSDGIVIRSGDAVGSLLIFGDVLALYDSRSTDGHTDFKLNSVDVVASVDLGNDFRVLSETVFHANRVSMERLWASYAVHDSLYMKFGTEHSPISKWNYEYHHGAYLETTVTRPILARFEGDDGILPMHRTGLETGGRVFTEEGSFTYFATISNGRGASPSDKQTTADANDSKAIDLGIDVVPDSGSRTRLGIALTFDDIPPDASVANPDRSANMSEWIATANVSAALGPTLFRSELALIQHEGRVTGTDYSHTTGFIQLELPGDEWTPYLRGGLRAMDEGDPFYAPLDRDLDESRGTIGMRRELGNHMALKMELSHGRKDVRTGTSISGETVTSAAFQLAWSF